MWVYSAFRSLVFPAPRAVYFFLPAFSIFVISAILFQSFAYSVRTTLRLGLYSLAIFCTGLARIRQMYAKTRFTADINSTVAKITVPIIVMIQIHFLSLALFSLFANLSQKKSRIIRFDSLVAVFLVGFGIVGSGSLCGLHNSFNFFPD